jgi:hypothetical protein
MQRKSKNGILAVSTENPKGFSGKSNSNHYQTCQEKKTLNLSEECGVGESSGLPQLFLGENKI